MLFMVMEALLELWLTDIQRVTKVFVIKQDQDTSIGHGCVIYYLTWGFTGVFILIIIITTLHCFQAHKRYTFILLLLSFDNVFLWRT